MTLLWSNPSPTSTFAAQTVTLSESLNNYDYLCLDYYFDSTDISTHRLLYSLAHNYSNSIFGIDYRYRQVTINDTTVAFSIDPNFRDTTHNIPIAIYGVKVRLAE